MQPVFFDDLESDSIKDRKPFFAIDHSNENEVFGWLKSEYEFLQKENEERFTKIKNNYQRYKGYQYKDQNYQSNRRDTAKKKKYTPTMVIPLISDAVDERTARLTEFKPNVAVIPLNDEAQDKTDAKIAKRFLKHVDNMENLDDKFQRWARHSFIAGESFLGVFWNPDKGDPVEGSTDQNRRPIFIGDVEVKNISALDFVYERAKSWDQVNYGFYTTYDYTEALKKDYKTQAEMITEDRKASFYDFESMEEKSLEGKTLKIHFFHKKTRHMPYGFEACFTMTVLLKNGMLSYEDGELPLERLIDVENPEELSGESFIEKNKSMASQFNNLTNLIVRNQMLASHPKWFVEGGSVDETDLGNDITVVKIKAGSRPPVLAQANPTPTEVFNFRQTLKDEYYQMSKSQSVTRGEPPPGITAFVALQFVTEQENRRSSTTVTNYNTGVRNVYRKALKRCAQYYRKEDKRTMLLLGKDNRWTAESYDPESLKRDFAVVLQNLSALPESKAVRTQFIMDMGKNFPNIFPPEQIIEMLDLAQSEKFMDEGAAAARSAEAENEMIFDGNMPPPPESFENLIVHWKVHISAIQDIGFKTKSSPQVRQAMEEHIGVTEMLMFEMMQKNSVFAQMVATQCPQFPVFMTPPLLIAAPMPMNQVVQAPPPPSMELAPLSLDPIAEQAQLAVSNEELPAGEQNIPLEGGL